MLAIQIVFRCFIVLFIYTWGNLTGPTCMPSAQKNKDSKWKARNAQLATNGHIWVLGSFFGRFFLFSSSMFFPTRSQPSRTISSSALFGSFGFSYLIQICWKTLEGAVQRSTIHGIEQRMKRFSDVRLGQKNLINIEVACQTMTRCSIRFRRLFAIFFQNIWLARVETKCARYLILSISGCRDMSPHILVDRCDLSPMWSVFFRATGTVHKEWRFTHRIMGSCLAGYLGKAEGMRWMPGICEYVFLLVEVL